MLNLFPVSPAGMVYTSHVSCVGAKSTLLVFPAIVPRSTPGVSDRSGLTSNVSDGGTMVLQNLKMSQYELPYNVDVLHVIP